MAAILTVGYTPNYAGNHRICFKTTGETYCCYNDDSASIIGVQKSIDINLDDFELCLGTLPASVGCAASEVDGYVQPTCIDQTSDINRSPFIATFGTTVCNAYNITCEESGIAEITIDEPGYGWPTDVVPTITINDSSASGSGFVGTVTMNCVPGENFCSIDSVTIDDAGQGYIDLNTLSVDISPLPTCISNELLINGHFINGFDNWTISPFPDSWFITVPSNLPFYNIPVHSSTGGSIEQIVLESGKSYLVQFEKAIVKSVDGVVRFIVTAGLFSNTGTEPNQYMITKNAGDPDYDAPLTITLQCFGSGVFSIYGDSTSTSVDNRSGFTRVSVVELCTAIDPELQVTALDDCGTFTVTDCDGTANPTEYQLLGGEQYAINVCSGGTGPDGVKYTITPNPTYGGLGPELLVNNTFETNLDGWAQDLWIWSSEYGGSASSQGTDSFSSISQDILTVGQEYTIQINLSIIFDGECTPEEEAFTAFTIYAGTAVYGPLNFSGSESFTFNITCTDNPTFKIEAWDPEGCTSVELIGPQMYCSFVSVKGQGAPIPVSCCDCVKYDVINTGIASPIEFYYTDCLTQVITTESVDAGDTIQVCAVRNSIWVSDTNDNQNFEYIVSLVQDCQ
jgi:hypothetical protein